MTLSRPTLAAAACALDLEKKGELAREMAEESAASVKRDFKLLSRRDIFRLFFWLFFQVIRPRFCIFFLPFFLGN